MMSKSLKSDALKALQTYGHDTTLWPDQDLAKAVKSEASLTQALEEAAKLDDALNGYSAPPPSDLLAGRILKAAAQTPQNNAVLAAKPTSRLISRPRFMRIAASLIACAVIGLTASHIHNRNQTDAALMAEIEADTLRRAANDMGMADIFLWVELADTPQGDTANK